MMKWQQTVLIHFFGQLKPGRGSAEKVEEAYCPLLMEQEIVSFHSWICSLSCMERTAGRDVPSQWREHLGLSTLSWSHPGRLQGCPCQAAGWYLPPPQLQRTHGMSSTSPHRGCGVAVTVAFVEGQVEDGVFQAPRLMVAAHFGAMRRRRKFAVQSWSWDME